MFYINDRIKQNGAFTGTIKGICITKEIWEQNQKETIIYYVQFDDTEQGRLEKCHSVGLEKES